MRLSIFNEYDKVLLLGEGNFSFSVALNQLNLNLIIVATCFETLPINDSAVKNIKILKEHGVTVYLGVDATNLSNNFDLTNKKFNKIIFNFPHVCSKMRLDLNRELLQKFFESAEKFLEPNGNVLVTLCNGQGGTYFDRPPRRWDDSWKIKEMAAHGNFILTTVEPFLENNFPNYSNTGFRGQDKLFFNQQALTHIFKNVHTPNLSDLKALITFDSFIIDELSQTDSQTWNQIIPETYHKVTFGPPFFFFDLTFSTISDFNEKNFYRILYNNVGRIIKDVEFLRLYEFPNSTRIARTYRLCYHAEDVPLFRKRVIDFHDKLIPIILKNDLSVIVD